MDEKRLPSSPPTRREAPGDLSAESADSWLNLIGFHSATTDFLPKWGKRCPLFYRLGETEYHIRE
jgi:hypothetical protein